MSEQMDAPIFRCAGRFGGKISYKPSDLVIDVAGSGFGYVTHALIGDGNQKLYVVSCNGNILFVGSDDQESSSAAETMFKLLETEQPSDPDDLFTSLAEEISVLASGDKADTTNAYSLLTHLYALFITRSAK